MDIRNYVYIPVCLYSMTGSMFLPVVQSMIYQKVCMLLSNETGIYDCVNAVSEASKNQRIQTEANRIVLIASICLCTAGILTSRLIGRISDKKSRKMSMLIPFIGLLLADGSLLLQAMFFESTPYFFPLSELIFGCFGGYMAIISTSFAYITSIPGVTSKERSKSIARLEGALGAGVIPFEMFARFPATGLRSLISNNVPAEERGSAFAVVAILEGGCKLVAALVFHLLFPWSISFMPQLSFVLMAALIAPPTLLLWYYQEELEHKDGSSNEEGALNNSPADDENTTA
ncbi:hypothetical protein ANCCEY_08944 [Ancylostoma ceylanicum]|uniref:Major facilitator superfamily (MFS) profile domain-containing protein n=1 Tax=Ancylostoma ceylanicum TaxID=53326 RepID=A0A0D6LIT6_9BILA|nr:hypothetical protein ANCCEY_08944 [Ancylostoma ceylanicum]